MKRFGTTLLELILVVAITALLLGLLLAGIQKVRQAALRTDTSNRIRQITLGLNSYELDHQSWPSSAEGWIWRTFPETNPGSSGIHEKRGGHFVVLYPYVNAGQAKALFRNDVTLAWETIPDYREPGDPTIGFRTTYYGEHMIGSFVANWQVFGDEAQSMPQKVSDGRSQTIAYSTRFGNRCGRFIPPEHYGTQVQLLVSRPANVRACFADGGPGSMNRMPSAAEPDEVPMDYPVVTPGQSTRGSRNRTFIVTRNPEECDARVPVSGHPAGLLVGFCDGSVRLLSPAMSQESFWGLVTPNAGDLASLD